MINDHDWEKLSKQFSEGSPFKHIIIDNFWDDETAAAILKEFPEYDSPAWTAHYLNAIEDKKAGNHWDKFPKTTYKAFSYLNSAEFISNIKQLTGNPVIYPDVGLHGGGWHGHKPGGKLNVHLDYSIHPKLGKLRNYNIIIYMTPDWNPAWGGGLEIWSHDDSTGQPKELTNTIDNKFNRAVIFDTTQNSWHGLPDSLSCPDNTFRRSMAVYYLTEPTASTDSRTRALFAPSPTQIDDPEILALIERRSK
jgi:Rps23 Pro-64 3,4-dihydroxylase Tpa1-like proline 4-hydroxylase